MYSRPRAGGQIGPYSQELVKMPYTPANNSIVQCILHGHYAEQEWMNVVHFVPINPPSGDIADGLANLQDIASIVDEPGTGWSFLRAVYTSTSLEMDYLQLQYVWPQRFAYTRIDADVLVGTQVGDASPPNVSACITYQADTTGRRSRCTQHIPGLVASDVETGIVNSTIRGHMDSEATFMETLFTATGAGIDYMMCIYNREDPALSNVITHHAIQRTSRVERRRTVGLGT